jgi:DHA2 family multidrug resistance protein
MGFALMAVWLGSMQLVLDKGQEADWFGATWIRWLTALSVAALLGFIARELLCRDPIVQLHVLADTNFRTGTLITGLFGVLLYGVTAFLPLFLQTLLGYSAMDSGLAVSPRGLGSMVAMVVVGALVSRFDGRFLLAVGLAIFAVSTLMLSRINLGISMSAVAWPNFLNGFGGGFVFVPLTTLAMGRLRKQEMGNAAGIYNLVRNIGGSIGIAALTAFQVRGAQIHQSYMSANLTPDSPATANAIQGLTARFQTGGADAVLAHQKALGSLYDSLQQQAAVLAYADNFRLLGYLALGCIPLVLLMARPRDAAPGAHGVAGE